MAKVINGFGMLRALAVALAVIYSATSVNATSVNTQWEGLAHTLALSLESYTKRHNGELPPDLDSLFTGSDAAIIEAQLGGPISSKVAYFKDTLPGDGDEQIIATISFPINEDRREEVGRYIIYRNKNEINSRWESDKALESAFNNANMTLPDGAVYNEKPIKPLYAEYTIRLVEDAVKNGVGIQEAVAAVEKHVEAVTSGRAQEANTWDEVVANQPAPTPPITSPQSPAPSLSTPRPSATATPMAAEEKPASEPGLPIVPVVILVAAIAGAVVFFLRRKS